MSLLIRPPLNGALGAPHSLATNFVTSSTHTTFQDEGLTKTVDDVAGRRYVFTLVVNPYVSGGANSIDYQLLRDGVAIHQWSLPTDALSTSIAHGATFVHAEVIAVTHPASVYKVQIKATTNNTAVSSFGSAATPRQLIIQDVGAI